MKTVILGANGQLGTDLGKALSDWNVTKATRAECDVTDAAATRAFLTSVKPDLVINTTAFHHLDTCETQPEKAFAVNATAVRDLATIARDLNATFLHVSTDYAYGADETRSTPYSETELAGPVNTYGVSKIAGELFVKAICPKHYVVRTCGLYGVAGASGKGGNFVELMIRLAKEGKPIKVVSDQFATPTATKDLAAKIRELATSERYGLYHVTSEGSCSWYEFAGAIFANLGLTPQFGPQTSAESGAKTRRPGYSVLAKDGLKKAGLKPMRPWQEALTEYLRDKGHLTASTAAAA